MDVFVAEGALRAVNHVAELAGIDEEHLVRAVNGALGTSLLVLGEEPDADRNLRTTEELRGKCDDAGDDVIFHHGFADIAFTGGVRRHRAIGHDDAGLTLRSELGDNVLHPREVCIALGWNAVFPASVFLVARPILDVERWVGHDVVHLFIRMDVAGEGVGPALTQASRANGVDGQVHLGHAPGALIKLLTVDGQSSAVLLCGLEELFGLHEHAA